MNYRDCLNKAERNHKFLQHEMFPLSEEYPDWVCVVAFYSALHFVDAYLILKHGLYYEHHDERDRAVALYMNEVYGEYHRLYDLSFRARYMRVEDNPSPDEADQAVTLELYRVREFVTNIVG